MLVVSQPPQGKLLTSSYASGRPDSVPWYLLKQVVGSFRPLEGRAYEGGRPFPSAPLWGWCCVILTGHAVTLEYKTLWG
jgi:hypothetical protein